MPREETTTRVSPDTPEDPVSSPCTAGLSPALPALSQGGEVVRAEVGVVHEYCSTRHKEMRREAVNNGKRWGLYRRTVDLTGSLNKHQTGASGCGRVHRPIADGFRGWGRCGHPAHPWGDFIDIVFGKRLSCQLSLIRGKVGGIPVTPAHGDQETDEAERAYRSKRRHPAPWRLGG